MPHDLEGCQSTGVNEFGLEGVGRTLPVYFVSVCVQNRISCQLVDETDRLKLTQAIPGQWACEQHKIKESMAKCKTSPLNL